MAAVLVIAGVVIFQGVQLRRTQASLDRLARLVEEGADGDRRERQPTSFTWNNAGPSPERLREIVRDELRARAPTPTAAATDDDKAPAPAPTPASVEAYQRGQRVVADAIAARVWTDKEAAQLRRLMRDLTKEQFEALGSQLIPAINAQQVRVETDGPLF